MGLMHVEMDRRTSDVLDDLKDFFGVETRADSIRSAIAFALVVKDAAKDGELLFRDLNRGGHLKVIVRRNP